MQWRVTSWQLHATHLTAFGVFLKSGKRFLRPLARLNFAAEPRYDIRPKSLVDIYAKKFGARADRLQAAT